MLTKDEALFRLDASEVRAGQKWKHTKTGNTYTIVATGIAEATLTPVVIYAGYDGVVWVRALDVFLANNDEGKARFLLVEEAESQTAPFEKLEAVAPQAPRRCCLASGFPPFDHSLDCTVRSAREARSRGRPGTTTSCATPTSRRYARPARASTWAR